jgi:hypothetical protein
VGQPVAIALTCTGHPACADGGVVWDVRAYGPAVVTGRVHDFHNGTYLLEFVPWDAGVFVVEAVVAYSQRPAWHDLPRIWTTHPVSHYCYEGYLLPEFPLEIDIAAAIDKNDDNDLHHSVSLPYCTTDQLVDHSPQDALVTRRWVVSDVNRGKEYQGLTVPSLTGYKTSVNSLGVRFQYQHRYCNLISESDVQNPDTLHQALRGTNVTAQDLHVILIGDSNMYQQQLLFQDYFGGSIKTSLLGTYDGLMKSLPDIKDALQRILSTRKSPSTRFYILFNSGLHDMYQMCAAANEQNREIYIPHYNNSQFTCLSYYETLLTELVQLVLDFPADLRVWQSTTAAWPKWGNYQGGWPPQYCQVFPMSPQLCEVANEVAWPIMQRHSLPIMDAHWLTRPRPDHRQVMHDNPIGKVLVHAGMDVYSVLTRQWSMMILESLRNRTVST